jgi:hypothetical protein
MKQQTLIHSSVLAAIIIAAVIGVSMVTGFPGTKPFISVDPLNDKNAGDAFTITGTTNLPAGTDLMIQVYATSFEKSTSDTGEFSGAVGTVRVVSGNGGTNTWSMDVDTSPFVPMEYLVNASVFTGNAAKGDFSTGSPFGTTTFTIRPSSGKPSVTAGPDRAVAGGILIDPIRDTPVGDLLVVSGRTNLSAGTDLIVKVIPSSMDKETIARNYKTPENAAVTRVVKGTGVNNLFSVSLDTRLLLPADHIVIVSSAEDHVAGIDAEPAAFTGSALFNILPGKDGTGKDSSVPRLFINPPGDVAAGDSLVISGTTNLPAGSKFQILVIPASSTDFEHPEITAAASAVSGSSASFFSATLTTKSLPKGDHIIAVAAMNNPATGTILFTVK